MELKRLIVERIPEGDRRNKALQQIASLDPAVPLSGEDDLAKGWAALAGPRPSAADYNKMLAKHLQQFGCDTGLGGPYVIRGFARDLNERLGQGTAEARAVATRFLDEATCEAASGSWDEVRLPADTRAKLNEVKDGSPAAPPHR